MAQMGKLFIVSTPIGNLKDITARAVEILHAVGCIAAEDTRHTKKLLNSLGIENRLLSFHAHSDPQRAREILQLLEGGTDVALVTDAGTPIVSDPGFALTEQAAQRGIEIVSIPGPSAVIAALTVAALPADKFIFEGFLPRDRTRADVLKKVVAHAYTTILYESPHHLQRTLQELAAVCPARPMALCKELTKIYEHVYRGTVAEIAQDLADVEIKGEYVIVLAGAPPQREQGPGEDTVRRFLEKCREGGMSYKDAAALVAEILGIPKNSVYKISVALQKESN